MLTIHHLGVSQSERIVWLCEELELPYELVRYERDRSSRLAPQDYRALSRFGTAPILDDGARRLGESGAIIEYVSNVHGGGRLTVAPGAPNYADYLFWLHFANGSMMQAATIDMLAHRRGEDAEAGDVVARALRHRIDLADELVEARLGEAPFFAGDALTGADINMVFVLTTMRLFQPRDISGRPNLLAYLSRIGARPAYRRAMRKADPEMTPVLA